MVSGLSLCCRYSSDCCHLRTSYWISSFEYWTKSEMLTGKPFFLSVMIIIPPTYTHTHTYLLTYF